MSSHLSISIESYNKLKNDYHQFKQQNEEIQKDLNKTIKQTKEAIDLLKKENAKLKTQNIGNNTLSKNQIIQKLKEEKLLLSKKITELENEKNLHKCNNIIIEKNMRRAKSPCIKKTIEKSFEINSFNFSLINNKNNCIIKESLKRKNEEILILKNELMKKEQIIQKLKINHYNLNDSEIDENSKQNFINKNNKLFRTKSDNHFYISNNNYNTILTDESKNITKNNFQHNKNISKFYQKKGLDELNITLTNEDEEDNILEKNIQIELKNILEEKRNFILKTLTSENFSFDILSSTNLHNINTSNNNSNNINTSNNNSSNIMTSTNMNTSNNNSNNFTSSNHNSNNLNSTSNHNSSNNNSNNLNTTNNYNKRIINTTTKHKKNILSPTPKKIVNQANNLINQNYHSNNNNPLNIEEINNNIDKMLEMISKRKKDIEQERKYLEELKEQYNE